MTAERSGEWAIVEIFGHIRLAGFVTEVERFGAKMARVDVPEAPAGVGPWGNQVPALPGYTRYFGGSAIFSVTPTTEELARAFVARERTMPVDRLVAPALPAPADDVIDAEYRDEAEAGHD